MKSFVNYNAIYNALYTRETTWRKLIDGNAFFTSAAADVFWHTFQSNTNARQNVAANVSPAFIYLKASDYVSAIGLTPKLRIKVSLCAVNDVAPARTIRPGLYPCSGPTSGTTGGAALRQYAAGTVVTGSDSVSFVSPAADSMIFDQTTAAFAFPADGLYSIASLISGAFTANSAVHVIAELQQRFE